MHPAIYIMHRILQSRTNILGERRREYLDWWRGLFDELVGFEVADSDRLSEYAVEILNSLDKVIAPSSFVKDVMASSGVRSRIYVVPHGVDPEYYTIPSIWESAPATAINPAILDLFLYKLRRGVKIILFFLWHSAERKGWEEVRETYRRLRNYRKDIILVLKTISPRSTEFLEVADLGAVEIYGWLDETSKIALYDLSDIVLVFSRGGGFELNALESLARGIPTLTNDFGCFTDYVPEFLRVRRGERVIVLPNNVIHVGYGYKVDVDHAVNKILDILDNYDEYKAKVLEWREKILKNRFRWDLVASELLKILSGGS
jgi:hypothetical protein